jgi:hypothetical protein
LDIANLFHSLVHSHNSQLHKYCHPQYHKYFYCCRRLLGFNCTHCVTLDHKLSQHRLTSHTFPPAIYTVACYLLRVSTAVSCVTLQWVAQPVTVAVSAPVTSPLAGEGVSCTGLLRHSGKSCHVTAVEGRVLHSVNTSHCSFLRLFVPNSLTVHPRSFSLKAVLAASSFFFSGYSLQQLSSSRYILRSLLRIVRPE